MYFFINYQQENATSNSKQNAAALLDLIYLSSKSVPIFMNMLEKHLVLSPLRFEFEFYYVQPIQVSPLYFLRQSSIIVDLETLPVILVLNCSSVDHLHVLVYFFRSEADLKALEEIGRSFLECLGLVQRFERRSEASSAAAAASVRSHFCTASLSLVQLASATLNRVESGSTDNEDPSRSDGSRSALLPVATRFGWLSDLLRMSADLFEQQLTTLLHAQSVTSAPDFLTVRAYSVLLTY